MSIRKNTMYNLIGALLPMGLSLVITPTYIAMVGDTRYGVLALAWLLLGYFGLFDLGLGRATAQKIAELEKGSAAQRAESFWTALSINSALGIIGGLILWPVAHYFFGSGVNVDTEIRPELNAAIAWLVFCVPLATLSGVLTGTLQGRSQFLELNIFSVVSTIALQLAPLSVAWLHGPDLGWLLASVVITRMVSLIFLFWRCHVHVLQGQPRMGSMTQARSLLRFGGWVTVSSLVGPLMVSLDRFAIGIVSGAKAVTHYTVPYQLAAGSAVLPGALSSALFPRLSAAGVEEREILSTIAVRSVIAVMTPIMLFGVLIMEPFLRWWLSPEFAALAALPGQILLLGFWINGLAYIPYAKLQAAGRPDLVAKCHVAEVLPYMAVLYIALQVFGLPGAAVAYGLRTAADCFLLMYLSGDLSKSFKSLLIPGAILFFGLMVAANCRSGSLLWWGSGTALLALSLIWSWYTAPSNVRDLFKRAFK